MQIDNQIAALMGKALSNEADAAEMALLNQLFLQHPEIAQQYEVLKKIWSLPASPSFQPAIDAEVKDSERLNRIREKANAARQQSLQTDLPDTVPEPRNSRSAERVYLQIFGYAAAILLAVGLFYIFSVVIRSQPATKKATSLEVVAENGSRKRIVLPDGSTVILNAGSSIRYCKTFEGKTRDVNLYGEAFFEVVKNAKIPFHVHCSNIDIKVLGTAFNVKSYPDERTIETTLIRGLVEIHDNSNKNAKPIYLHPSEKIILARSSTTNTATKTTVAALNQRAAVIHLDTISKENSWIETAWMYNRLEFRKNTFEEIARKMERWYAVSIIINDASLKQQILNGSFENETLEQALQALQKITPFQFSIQNNTVIINASE